MKGMHEGEREEREVDGGVKMMEVKEGLGRLKERQTVGDMKR